MNEEEARARIFSGVSRETALALQTYAELIQKWQKSINLVSQGTIRSLWVRHFVDSTQLLDLATRRPQTWLDLGTGGGFPGLPCAILAKERLPETTFIFIESDQRKCVFLREVLRQTDTQATIVNRRIEDSRGHAADLITARALAPLPKLLDLAYPHLGKSGICLFPKGSQYKTELDKANERWQMTTSVIPSKTSPDSVILKLDGISHADP